MEDTLTLDGLPARGADEQEEREAEQLLRANPTPPVLVNWTKASRAQLIDGTLRPKLLVMATDHAGCVLIHHLVAAGTKQVAGSLVLPEVSMASNTVEPSVTDASCYLYSSGTDHQVLLAACQYETPDARATDVAAAVFEHCRPEHTVVLATASTSSSALRGAPPPPGGAFAVSTDAAVSAVAAAAAPTLPPGCVMDGLPAALLSHCQIRGRSLRVLLSMEHAPVTDAAAVVSLRAALAAEAAAAAATYAPLASLLRDSKSSLGALAHEVDKRRDASSFGAIFA